MPRQGRPEPYAVDADRGSGTVGAKKAQLLDVTEYVERGQARGGLRELDQMTEGLSQLTRLQKDRERIFPRATTAELGDPRMRRTLPARGDTRMPLSARQKNERSSDRRRTQATMPLTRLRAQKELVTRPDRWRQINDALSEHTSDIQALGEADQQRIRRIDRAIQAYERNNDRGHVLYANVAMPAYINHSNRERFVRNNFAPGHRFSFDRYTVATHQLHETASHVPDTGQVVVFEVETRRGAYLGQSDKKDNTGHLLPRGMRFEVVDVHPATYQTPDGKTGSRLVVQLRDITPD